jgi:tetratricopeptide (TPR) repeat protein
MLNEKNRSDYGIHIHRVKIIHAVTTAAVALLAGSILLILFIGWKNKLGNEKRELLDIWNSGDYEECTRLSGLRLQDKPMDYFLLTIHGFSAYQLGIVQINSYDTLRYIDESIWSLRKALLHKAGVEDGRVYYVLGKAYYYKGAGYADLAVKYLERSEELAYGAEDIPEYLGLAYAAVRDYRSSVAAFSLALNRPGGAVGDGGGIAGDTAGGASDVLLLSIARSYLALDELESARAYLALCIEGTMDSSVRVSARFLLGEALGKTGDSAGAEAQYTAILEEAGENAEARYQIGVLYASRGETTRARAEWRRAIWADASHAGARARLKETG